MLRQTTEVMGARRGFESMQAHVTISPMQREIVVSLADLRYVSIECPNCHTKVTLDMKGKSELWEKQDFFTPKTCPGCTSAYDTAIPRSLDGFLKSYEALLPIADRITFRGPMETD